jgi:Uma2 family endonuclease
MPTIELQPRVTEHLARWEELGRDPYLADTPFKIETDRYGRILMSPPPFSNHIRYVAIIIKRLNALISGGIAYGDTPLVTSDGVKVMDAAWISDAHDQELAAHSVPALTRAPLICVEVLSPSNTQAEMDEKRALYLEAGAQEVWLCGQDGSMSFYTPELSPQSKLCPSFPTRI